MPFGDGTGPLGQGPRTGRGAGFCGGFAVPGNVNPEPGRGRGGRGGRGWRHQFRAPGNSVQPATPVRDEETEVLKGQVEALQTVLNEMRRRIEALAAKPKQE
jgi:hypothetical protein